MKGTFEVGWGNRGAIAFFMIFWGLLFAGCGASRSEMSVSAASPSSGASAAPEEYPSVEGEAATRSEYDVDYSDSDALLDLDANSPAAGMSKSNPPSRSHNGSPAGQIDDVQQIAGPAEPSQPASGSAPPRKPMLLYEAHLGMAVFRTQENLDRIEKMAVKSGGYLLSRATNSIQVRVPASDFEEILQQIMALGDVHSKEVKAQDVTAEFTDTQIRLRNAQVVRDRLEQLLVAAKNVEEALQVEAQLARVTDQIERMKGRLKLLRELAAFSTINVAFTERTQKVQTRVDLPFPWLNELGLHHLLDL